MSLSRACKDAASNSAPRLPCSQRAATALFCRQGCRLTQWRRGPLAGPALSRACRLGTDRARGGRLTRWRPGPRLASREDAAVGLGAAWAAVAASASGGVAHLASPVPLHCPESVVHRAAASCGGGRARRLLAWRQVPRVACRACRH